MTSDEQQQRFFDSLLAAASGDLFAEYGVALRQVDQTEEPLSPEFFVCSVIGFSGRHVRGALMLAMTEELTNRSDPLRQRGLTRDWVGELSNQLLGRIKIALLRHGVEIYLNLPAVLRGEHLAPLPRKGLRPLKFVTAGGTIAIWLDVETKPEFQLDADADAGRSAPASGEPVLFE